MGMVLSGMIQHNAGIPAWMYHAQVGPRSGFLFDSSWVGITWVDLIFPMFLFAMGGALSYSIGKQKAAGMPTGSIFKKLLIRTLKLFLFAFAVRQLHPYALTGDTQSWIFGLVTFGAMILSFVDFKSLNVSKAASSRLNMAGMFLLVALIAARTFLFGKPFSLSYSDIIIMVLANVSLVGGLLYGFTYKNVGLRLMIVVAVVAMFMTSSEPGSWNSQVWTFSLWKFFPQEWLSALSGLGVSGSPIFINVGFWKYLIAVLLGSVVGDSMVAMNSSSKKLQMSSKEPLLRIGAYALLIVVANTTLLYMREIWLNLGVNMMLSMLLYANVKHVERHLGDILKFTLAILWIGLLLEAQQGGIRKDFTTIGYLVLTPALSSFIMVCFCVAGHLGMNCNSIAKIGQNPLVGYVAAGFFVLPILAITGILPVVDTLHTEVWCGFAVVRGLMVTLGMCLITVVLVNKKVIFKI